VEVSRDDIAVLLQRKPLAGMDLLTAISRQLHAAQEHVRMRTTRNPNDMIEQEATMGERVADHVARFGGSWTFVITFGVLMSVYRRYRRTAAAPTVAVPNLIYSSRARVGQRRGGN
jgi:CRP/FNR family cyclic AMP-dependent transcriptional regulator